MARSPSPKLSKDELRQQMLAIRADIIRKMEAVEVGLSDKPDDIKTRRAKVFVGDEAGFRFFAKTYFPHYFPDDTESEFHKWAYKTLPEVEKEDESISLVVAAPRGEAKTTLIAQIKTLYDEVRNAKHNNVIVSDTEEQADGIIEGIKTELETNTALALDFPEVCGKGAIWRIGEVRTRQGNKIKAYGQGQKIRGAKNGANRPDVVYLDDLENDDHVKNERLRKKLKDWIARVIQPLGGAGNKCDIFYVGTVLHIDSVLAQTLKNPFWRSSLFSSIIKWPDRMDLWDEWENIYRTEGEEPAKAFYATHEAEMLAGSQVSWSKRPLLVLMKIRARDGVDVFNTEYQNKPGNPDEAIFSEYIDGSYYAAMPLDVVYYGAVDPSLGKKGKGRDPSAILVGGYQKKTGILFVEEARIKKRVPSLIIQEVIELQKQYGCQVWVIETVQFQEFFKDELVKESAKLGIHVPARGVTPSVEKELRIESIQPHFANGFVKLSQTHQTLISQLREWPNHEHDDGPDALQMLWMAATTGSNRKPTKVIHIPTPQLPRF